MADDVGGPSAAGPSAPAEAGPSSAPPGFVRLTKQQKKALKAQRHHEAKLQWRQRAKSRRHEKTEARKLEREAKLAAMSEAELAAHEEADRVERARLYDEKVAQTARINAALEGGLRVAVDLSYSELMTAREQESLSRQLSRCWGANRRSSAPVSLQLAGLGRCPEACLPRGGAHLRWNVKRVEEDVASAFATDELIFLSPDAEEPLRELDSSKVYVIGGLVDGTVIKHTTLSKAEGLGAKAMRLPLAEHAGTLAHSRLPLTLPAVLEMLLLVNGGGSWDDAVRTAVAPRQQRAATQANSKAARRAEGNAARTATWNRNAGGGGGVARRGGGGGGEDGGAGSSAATGEPARADGDDECEEDEGEGEGVSEGESGEEAEWDLEEEEGE